MKRTCFQSGCTSEVLHNLSWRCRGPQVPGGKKDGYSRPGGGAKGTLAYSCDAHLETLLEQGHELRIPQPDEDGITIQLAEWSKALDALLALDFNPESLLHDKLTGADNTSYTERSLAAREKIDKFRKLFDTRITSRA